MNVINLGQNEPPSTLKVILSARRCASAILAVALFLSVTSQKLGVLSERLNRSCSFLACRLTNGENYKDVFVFVVLVFGIVFCQYL